MLKIKVKIHEETNLDNYNWLVSTKYKVKLFKDIDDLNDYIVKCTNINANSTNDFRNDIYIKNFKHNKYELISEYMLIDDFINDYKEVA